MAFGGITGGEGGGAFKDRLGLVMGERPMGDELEGVTILTVARLDGRKGRRLVMERMIRELVGVDGYEVMEEGCFRVGEGDLQRKFVNGLE